MRSRSQNEAEITALLIAPNRDLAQQFLATLPQTRAFQILADLKSYPPQQTLDIRTRQLKPNVVLLDLATDLAAAVELIRWIAAIQPAGARGGSAHAQRFPGDSAIPAGRGERVSLRALRSGHAARGHRPLAAPGSARSRRPKPKKGTRSPSPAPSPAPALPPSPRRRPLRCERLTGKRVLLADCDLTGGTIGFYLKLSHNYSLVDALQHAEHLDPALWNSLTVNYGGVDILPAPAAPYADAVDPARLRMLIDQARHLYDWVVLDLPTVFNRTSLMAISECERAFLISTAELPSLHLTRKALTMLEQLGFPKDRFHVLVNRVDRRDSVGTGHIEKLFGCKVHASLPNDYFSLHRVVTLGQPLGAEGDLGKAIESLAARLCGSIAEKKKGAVLSSLKPAFAIGMTPE